MFSVSIWRTVASASWPSSTREFTEIHTFEWLQTASDFSVLASDDKLDQSTLD